MMNANYTKAQTMRWLLVLDIAATLILIGSATLLIWNAHSAGLAASQGALDAGRVSMWNMLTALAFFMGAFAWLFGRFFKDRLAEINSPWK